LAKIESAVAVHSKRVEVSLYSATNRWIFPTSAFVLRKDPRRMAFSVMMLNHVSTWFSHDE